MWLPTFGGASASRTDPASTDGPRQLEFALKGNAHGGCKPNDDFMKFGDVGAVEDVSEKGPTGPTNLGRVKV